MGCASSKVEEEPSAEEVAAAEERDRRARYDAGLAMKQVEMEQRLKVSDEPEELIFEPVFKNGPALKPTSGKLDAPFRRVCIVSFPATLGQEAWKRMVVCGFNWACVWMGTNDSRKEEWFDAWAANVDEALKRGMTLYVVACRDHPEGNPYEHLIATGEDSKYRLDAGQQAQVDHLNEKGINYMVRSIINRGYEDWWMFNFGTIDYFSTNGPCERRIYDENDDDDDELAPLPGQR